MLVSTISDCSVDMSGMGRLLKIVQGTILHDEGRCRHGHTGQSLYDPLRDPQAPYIVLTQQDMAVLSSSETSLCVSQ